jgi:hypothetical protein
LHGREEFLPARGVLLLHDPLGEIEVAPADNDVLGEPAAALSDFLLDFVPIEEVLVVPEGDRARELIGALAFAE